MAEEKEHEPPPLTTKRPMKGRKFFIISDVFGKCFLLKLFDRMMPPIKEESGNSVLFYKK